MDGGDGPGVAVRDPQGGVVAAGRDPIPDPEPLPRAAVVTVWRWSTRPRAIRSRWMASLSSPTCARVSAARAMSLPAAIARAASAAMRRGAVGVARVQPHVSARGQLVEHPAGVGPGPDAEG